MNLLLGKTHLGAHQNIGCPKVKYANYLFKYFSYLELRVIAILLYAAYLNY